MAATAYVLRAELHGHQEDVRALALSPFGLITASRDNTAKIWVEAGKSFECSVTLVGHSSYVTCAAAVPACSSYPTGAVVTGSRDTTLRVWDPVTAATLSTMSGHQYQVTDVICDATGTLYSSSLDSSVRVWDGSSCKQELRGHQGAVQCLALLEDGDLLSGSQDTTVRVWRQGQNVASIPAHNDTVRGMAAVPGLGVVTVSHDLTGKVWTQSGDCLATLVGHDAIIYSVAVSPSANVLATGSEDNTTKLWTLDGQVQQTIEHPGCVWDVKFLSNGDLVTACSDGVARVWSCDPSRHADAATVQAYAAALQARKEAATAASGSAGGAGSLPAGLKLEDPSVLLASGSKDGQVKIIRENGEGVAYSWNQSGQTWEKIGTVVSGHDTMAPANKMFNGQVYDFVFDVDVEDGVPPRKLALNRGDNPYDVADSFLAREMLPGTYREQVVQFILQNTQGAAAFANPIPTNVDPFTGSGAYVPQGTALNPGPPSRSVDPYTGAGAYVPGTAGPRPGMPGAQGDGYSVTGGGVDPFTGSTAAAARESHVPCRVLMVFDNVPKAEGMLKKVLEFNDSLAADAATAGAAIPDPQQQHLRSLMQRAAAVRSTPSAVPDSEMQVLQQLLRWPAAQLFPALDLLRLLALSTPAAPQVLSLLGANWFTEGPLATAAAAPEAANTHLISLRLLTNCFQHEALKAAVLHRRTDILDAFAACTASENRNIRQAVGALLMNYSVAGCEGDDEWASQLLSAEFELLASCSADDAESLFRAAVAIGTLASVNKSVLQLACDLGIPALLKEKQAGQQGKTLEALKEATAALA